MTLCDTQRLPGSRVAHTSASSREIQPLRGRTRRFPVGSPCRGQHAIVAIMACAAIVCTAAGSPAASAGQRPTHVRASASSRPVGASPSCERAVRPNRAQCMSVLSDTAGPAVAVPGYGPVALRSAYKLTKAAASKTARGTVAIVGAFSDPNAATDLGAYRSHFKLPACTQANGCLRIVNEHGGTSGLPRGNPSWATLQTIGLDVISALCPNCKLLVVDAATNSLADLGTAEDTAVSLGAKFVFNGWSSIEFTGEDAFARDFNHPGVAIVFASGDQGYGPRFPVDLPYVTAVGGTTLTRSSFNSRGWAETAWTLTASGCATLGIKPSWQRADARTPAGCLNRT